MLPKLSILVVGGGAAGWLTACRMARALGANHPGGAKVTLIESPEIGTIGVGEGTFPTIKATLQILGIDEFTFMRECGATFKQGIKFADWTVTPQHGQHSHYFHPFENPYGVNGPALAGYWLLRNPETRGAFSEALTFQKRVADAARGPKRLSDGAYSGPLQYAYHLDAARFGQFLARRGQALGVKHLQGTVEAVRLDTSGAIDYVSTKEHGDLRADLYIDCTGQRADLIGKALGVPFRPINKTLYTDKAVVCQIPYPETDTPIPSYTISTAHEAGWTWDIGLSERRGVGYVYSASHTSDDRAETILRGYLGDAGETASTRIISFRAGYREHQWVKNCVAIGLSAGFFEPLESTGMVLIEIAVGMLAELYNGGGPTDGAATRFNYLMKARCERITDFIKLHYCLSKRQEDFWRDNTAASSISDTLSNMLDMWKYRPPNRFDFLSDLESFSYVNYQYILYGMGFETDFEAERRGFQDIDKADKLFARIREFGEQAVRELPSHRALITHVNAVPA